MIRTRHTIGSRVKKGNSKKTVRRLCSSAAGHFRVNGRYSYATVRGTVWLVAYRCDSTLTCVTRGRVGVRPTPRKERLRQGRAQLRGAAAKWLT